MIDAAEKERATVEIMETLGYRQGNAPKIEMVSAGGLPNNRERDALRGYNAAIDALDVLSNAEGFDASEHYRKTLGLLDGLKTERRIRFETLIDWHAIAGEG